MKNKIQKLKKVIIILIIFLLGIIIGMYLIEPTFIQKDRPKSYFTWEYNFNDDWSYSQKCLEYYSQKVGISKIESEDRKIGDEFLYWSRDFEICLPKKYDRY